MDLAIRHFRVDGGLVEFVSRKTPFSARGERLRAQLVYDLIRPRYTGTVSISPLYLDSEKNRPFPINVNIPLALEKERVEVSKATLSTQDSRLEISAALEDVLNPRISARLLGRVAADDLHAFSPSAPRRAAPMELDLAAQFAGNRLTLSAAHMKMGDSQLEASGALDDVSRPSGAVRFNATVNLGEIGRIFNVSSRPEGRMDLSGHAKIASSSDYTVAGTVTARNVSFRQGQTRLRGIQATSKVELRPDRVGLDGLRLTALGGSFAGRAGLRDMQWAQVEGTLSGFSVRELAALQGPQKVVWDGTISGPVSAAGNIKASGARSWRASARLRISPGNQGVPLAGRIDANYDGRRDTVDLDNSYIATPHTRLDVSGAVGSQLRVRLASTDLNDFLPAIALASSSPPKELPVALQNGSAVFEGTVTGKVGDPQVAGRVSVTNLAYNEQRLDKVAAEIALSKSGAAVKNAVAVQQKVRAQLDGFVPLREWKPDSSRALSAKASVRGDLASLTAMAGRKDIPLSGNLAASAQATGTMDDPRAQLDLEITKGVAYDEPFDRLHAKLDYSSRAVNLSSAQLAAGNARVDLNGAFEHPPNDFNNGRLRFQVTSNAIALEQIRNVQQRRPGLTGTLQLNATGAAALQPEAGKPKLLLSALNADVTAKAVEIGEKRVGNLNLTARTTGSDLAFRLESNFANAAIRGDGNWRLQDDYPIDAKVTFAPVRLSYVRDWLAQPSTAGRGNLDGVIEGAVTVSGPVRKPEDLKGELRLTKLEAGGRLPAAEAERKRQPVMIRAAEPVVVTLERSLVRVQSAHLVGPSTDLALAGTVSLRQTATADLRVKGGIGLELLQALDPDVFASGNISIDTSVQGALQRPAVRGRVELKNAALNMVDVPNGLSKANGVILFDGTRATIEKLTGETGGGQVSLNGTVSYAGQEVEFRLQADAKEVRVRYPESTSTKADASLSFVGNTRRSLLSGMVTILQVNFQPHTDFGSVLAPSAEPVKTEEQKGLLAGTQLDIRVETSPNLRLQTALAQDLQGEANLRVRGTLARPGMLGRVYVTQGEAVFFGTKYTINQGTVSFFNPQRIEPILDINLETKARGIDVILTISGPMDKLKVTHRSDPPLQFSEVVSLLATGKPPTSDPALVARQDPAPQQTWQQMGATYLGQAIANPVSGRLQRLFGVTKLKIDPQITGEQNNPQARLTFEQQVTKDLTFTYIQDVSESNSQIVRIEWAFSKTWSAIALREQNGQVGLDFLYKKRFK